MKINHIYNDTQTSFDTGEKELVHPKSSHSITCIHTQDKTLNISVSVQPAGSNSEEWLCVTIYINGKGHTIFNGSIADSQEFFSKFPKN